MELGRSPARELRRRRESAGVACSPLDQSYAEVWERYEARCLWNVRRGENPSIDDAHVATCLR